MNKFLVFCVLTLGVGVLADSGPKVVDKVWMAQAEQWKFIFV